jgi:hypothetical protein
MYWSLAPHAKVNRDCGFDFHRLPIQKKWLVAPLLDCLDRGGREQRVPTNDLQVLNVPAFVISTRWRPVGRSDQQPPATKGDLGLRRRPGRASGRNGRQRRDFASHATLPANAHTNFADSDASFHAANELLRSLNFVNLQLQFCIRLAFA